MGKTNSTSDVPAINGLAYAKTFNEVELAMELRINA
jgi:hypothetical protein